MLQTDPRMMAHPAVDHSLTAVGIFRDLSQEDRAAMEAELDKIQLARGEALVRQGEAADALYIVVSGRFGVFVRGRDTPVAEIGPGMPIGEIAFLAGGERTATVMAVRDSLVLRLGRAEFDRLCQRAPQIWRTLTATLANRLADQTAGRGEIQEPVPRTITLVPAGPGPLPETFVELIRSAFAEHGRTQTIRSSDVPALAGCASVLRPRLRWRPFQRARMSALRRGCSHRMRNGWCSCTSGAMLRPGHATGSSPARSACTITSRSPTGRMLIVWSGSSSGAHWGS
jgi:CRP-like cAMP-binding protein